MKVLIYSFEKFGKLEVNPAAEIVEAIKNRVNNKIKTELIILPTSFELWQKLESLIESFKPDLIIGVGVKDAPRIHLEWFALNMIDTSQPDNTGKTIRHQPIDKKADNALSTNFEINDLLDFLKNNNIPSKISYFADTYVCNYAYFNCLNYINKNNKKIKTFFIHIPLSPKEVNRLDFEKPSFPTEKIAEVISDYLLKIKDEKVKP